MHILQVTNTYYPELKFGGPPQKIHALSRRLAERGHTVTVLTFNSRDQGASGKEVFEGVTVEYLPWRGWGLRQWPRDDGQMGQAVAETGVIHCYGLYNFLCPKVAKLAKKNNRPYLVEPLGMYQPRARSRWLKRIYHRIFTRRMFEEAAMVVATSVLEFEELKGAVPESRLGLRRNGIDVAEFARLPAPEAFRRRFGIEVDERVVLYLGRISPIKNLVELVRAFGEAQLSQSRLVLAGPENEADYAARLRRLVGELGLNGKVIFTGPLFGADKLAAFAAAELFVLPSLSESFGNAAAEAVAAGVPVLLTQTCGIAPVVHERAGLAVPLGTNAIAEGLRVMWDREMRAKLVLGRAQLVEELSWDQPVRQTEQLYAAVLEKPR